MKQTGRFGISGFGMVLIIGIGMFVTRTPLWAKKAVPVTAHPAAERSIGLFLNFDDIPVGKLPSAWVADATRLRGPMETWQVIEDSTAPSGKHVLAMTKPNHSFGGTFNICWTNTISFLNGEISVRFKALKGRGDQGGGIMWRVRDKNNYYVARFNPLEDNFRVYSVVNGVRRTLASATVRLPSGKWHIMKIVQQGNCFEGYLNGKRFLDGKWKVLNAPGGVGVWTKADAVTSFDDFCVRPPVKKGTHIR